MLAAKIPYLSCILFLLSGGSCLDLLGVDTGQIKGQLQWDIQVKRIENCKNQGTQQIVSDVRLKRISRTRVDIEGNLTFKIDYGDNLKIVADLSYWGNGGWKNNAYRFTVRKACSEFSVFENQLMDMRRRLGMLTSNNKLLCPIPKGRYELKSFDTSIINNISIPFYTVPTLWKLAFSHYLTAENKLVDCKSLILESRVKKVQNK